MSNWGNKRNAYYGEEKVKIQIIQHHHEEEEDEDNLELQEANKLQEKKFSKISELKLLESDEEDSEIEKVNDSDTISEDNNQDMNLETLLSKEDKDEISQLFTNIKISMSDLNDNIYPYTQLLRDKKMKNV